MKRELQVGQQVKVRGLDMRCKQTVEVVRIVEILPADHPKREHYDCVTEGPSGVQVFNNSDRFLFV